MATSPRTLIRVFSSDKVVPSRAMNRMGAQVARTVLARMLHNLRPVSVDPSIRDEVATLRREGMVMIPDFLPQRTFEEVRRRSEELLERERSLVTQIHHGPNTLDVLSERVFPVAAQLPEFFTDPRLVGILEAVERRPG